MKRERRTVPGYERYAASGALLRRYSGVEARLKDGDSAAAPSATWFILGATIGNQPPRVGDVCWGTDGVTRTVASVGEETADGEWPCVCEREVKT